VGVIANGIGNILLQAQGIGQNFIANTGIRSGSGNIAILAPDAISLANSTADITTGGGDIDLQASSLTTLSGVTVSSDGGDIRQVVTGNLLLTHLTNAGTGNVNLITGGSILDDSDTDTVDIEAAGLLISAITNVGERTNFIETSVDTISATAGGFQVLSTFSQGVTQGIHLLDSDAVTVGNVSVATSQVQMDGSVMTTTNSGSDLTTTGSDAPIALKTTNGPITINDGTDGDNLGISANGSGSILLQAQGTGSDIMVNTGITSGSGNISILAADSISQTGTSADITTSGGTIDLEATTGSIAMTTSTTAANSNGGTIRYRAGTNVGVGFIDAGTGDVSIMAGVGSIVDISAATDASAGEDDSSVNIQADELRLQAGDSIGLNTEFLETTVNRVSGIAAGIQGINLLETDDVTVGTVGPVSVARVQMDASTVTITDGTQSDLITSGNNGPIALKTSNGSIIIDDGDNNNIGVGVNGDGNILLQAQGSDRSITLNTAFHSDTGYISILVPNSINQANATSDISTDGGTIDLEAATGTISQADGAQTTSNGGNIRYSAGQNITLSNLNAGTGDISLITNNGDILDGGDSDLEIQADEILVQIGSGSLGSSPNPLEIQVNTASLRTNPANAVHLNPLDGLRLGAIGEITVNRVQMNPTVTVPISDGDTPAGGGATPGPTSPTIDTPEDRLPREEEGKAPTEPGPFNQALVAQSPCPPVDVGLEKLESDYSNEFREYLNIGEDNAAGANSQVLTIACDTLGTVAGITGITPALLYANFVPAGEPEQNLPYGGDSGGDRAREPNPSDQLDLLLVMPDGSTVYKRVATATRGQVAQEVEALVLAITDRIDEEFPAAQQLYQWLIAPLESELEQGQVENLVFIADIALRSLPFAVLHDGEQFLIEKYSLGLMPSLSLTNTRRHNIATNQILAMGTAEFPGQAPLPFVPLELDLVLSGPWQGRDFANQAFTLENLKTAQADSGFGIVHLATHATFNMGAPDRSTIQFADGQLSLENIQEVNWDGVNLLVLSACETAIGDREAELGWAGIAAKTGVESVLASLWPVEDGGSTALMAEFYRQLHQTSTKAEALRQTQLAMLRREIRFSQGQLQLPDGNRIAIPEALQAQLSADFDHPYHWAAFTLVGSPW
jgi:CHAT domain-containing protein